MKLPLTVSLILLLVAPIASAQKQNPSFIYKNRIISYSITRYTPTWEIQPATHKDSDLVAGSKLFRQVRASQTSALRAMMYSDEHLPSTVSGLEGNALIDHWKRNRVRMYFRIKYKGYNVFLARLNDHNSRSIMPFKDEDGKWELDTEFMEEPLFECLQDVDFDPFTGKFIGKSTASLSFDGIEDGFFVDYSSNDTRVSAKEVTLVSGRIGKCAKLDGRSGFKVPFNVKKGVRTFHIDCHINIQESLIEDGQTVFTAQNEKGKGLVLSRKLEKDGITKLQLAIDLKDGTRKKVELLSKVDSWFHLNITQKNGHLVVQVDGNEIGSISTLRSGGAYVGDLAFGGKNSARCMVDELNIGH